MSEKFKKFPGKSGNFSFRKEFFVGTILEALHAVKNSSQNTQFFETFPAQNDWHKEKYLTFFYEVKCSFSEAMAQNKSEFNHSIGVLSINNHTSRLSISSLFSAILLSFQRCHTTCGSRHHFCFRLLNILYLVLSNTLVKILFFEQKAIQGLEFIFYNYNKTLNAVLTPLPALHIRLNCKFLLYFLKFLIRAVLYLVIKQNFGYFSVLV